jgi:hypothetical protein
MEFEGIFYDIWLATLATIVSKIWQLLKGNLSCLAKPSVSLQLTYVKPGDCVLRRRKNYLILF